MEHKCYGCFWETGWEDENGSFSICERKYEFSFKEAKEECAKPGPCKHYTAVT